MLKPLTHAGGVVVRMTDAGYEVLLITTKDGLRWVVPGGHIDPGEHALEAAKREVFEEAGIPTHGNLWGALGVTEYTKRSGEECVAAWYLLQVDEKAELNPKPERNIVWVPLAEVEDHLTYQTLKPIMDIARIHLGEY